MKLQGNINGKCVTLEIKDCGQNRSEKRLPKNHFDESKNFIINRYETKDDIISFFSADIFKSLFRNGSLIVNIFNKYVAIEYSGKIYYYVFTTGRWFVETNVIEPTVGSYFTSSIRSLVWDYILREDAQLIKSSFATKNEMILALNNL
jgi:hypothetical protein